MGAPKGNEFWKSRTEHGRAKIFKTPAILLEVAMDYFQWCEDNPLEKAIIYQGEISSKSEKLMRAMTMGGLCVHMGVNSKYLYDFMDGLDLETSEGKDFSDIIGRIKDIMRSQKFEGASAGLLNANIIARDLGLAEKSLLTGTGEGGAIKTEATTFNFIPVGKDA